VGLYHARWELGISWIGRFDPAYAKFRFAGSSKRIKDAPLSECETLNKNTLQEFNGILTVEGETFL